MGKSFPVKYNGVWLHKNSKCYTLYESKDFKALDALMKQLDRDYDKLTK